jgi:hypothetical protein
MRQAVIAVVAVLLVSLPALPNGAEGRISGTVRSASTGEPLKSAVVILRLSDGAKIQSTTRSTSSDGSFAFTGLTAGRYQLAVQKSGYQPLGGPAGAVILNSGQSARELTLPMQPAGVISGIVRDWEGEPVAEAEVSADRMVYQQKGVSLEQAGRSKTDDRGVYRVFGLPAGEYLVRASPPRNDTDSGRFYAKTATAYYPGAALPSQALPLKVNWAGHLEDIDVHLLREPTFAISGFVWDADMDGPCTRCTVRALQIDGPFRLGLPQAGRVSKEGILFLNGLASGDYKLLAGRGTPEISPGLLDVTLRDDNLTDLRMTVGLQRAVSGRIILDRPPDQVNATEWLPYLRSRDGIASWPLIEGEIDEGLRFVISDTPPGTYSFEIRNLPAGAYLKSLSSGSAQTGEPSVTVLKSGDISGLRATIAFDGGTLSGQIITRRSEGEATPVLAHVYLIPGRNQRAYLPNQRVEAAPDGTFRFETTPPGAYALVAIAADSSVQVFDPAAQAALHDYQRQVDIGSGESVNLELPLFERTP